MCQSAKFRNGLSLTLLATVDELSSVDTLSCDEELSPLLESVWVAESNLGQGSTTAGIVDDILDKAIKKPVSILLFVKVQQG